MFHASSRKPENVYIVVEGKRSLESPPAGSTVVFDIHVGCHPDGTLVHPVNGRTTIVTVQQLCLMSRGSNDDCRSDVPPG